MSVGSTNRVRLSMGTRPYLRTDVVSSPLAALDQPAVENLVDAGIVVVVAAGNSDDDACSYSPAREATAITVGATASDDQRSYFSNTGSCVDNTRAAGIATAIANKLGVDVSQLPVVATAPEAAMEKAVSIGTWAVAMGLPTHVGVVPPVTGSPLVVEVLTETAKDLLGGYFIVEPEPKAAAAKIVTAIQERRQGLGL